MGMGSSDLGVHIDGYVALVATTVVVGGAAPVTGRAADAIMACKTAADVIIRMLQPGMPPPPQLSLLRAHCVSVSVSVTVSVHIVSVSVSVSVRCAAEKANSNIWAG
jgi:hypothetical protein